MKTSIRTIILTAASIFAAMSCQKEESVPGAQDQIKAGETIQVNLNASLGDFVSADGTKATAESVVRLKWTNTDKVDAYCGTTKLNEEPITVTPSENGLFAKLSGTITAPETGKTITFVYSNGCTTTNGLTFDLSNQTDYIPFVAFATLVCDGTATLTDRMVEFKFATSVMKIAATNLGGGRITDVAISGINTKVSLTPNAGSEPCGIAGSEKASITKTAGIEASSDSTRAIITVGIVPDNNKGRNITVSQTSYTNKGVITSDKIESSTFYTTPASLFTCGTLGSGADAHDYVLIAGTKWATQNLAVSSSGQNPWLINDTSDVKVPGTTTSVQIGDYFQWGAHVKYCGNETDDDKGLLIYDSFTNSNTYCNITFKTSYNFNDNNSAPYYSTTDYTHSKYTKGTESDGIVTLTPSDDVASILWHGTWRMPTSAEFQALTNATYWKWDGDDKGYYVYAPQPGDAGKTNDESPVKASYDKSAALLFFPAVGLGYNEGLIEAGSQGRYLSSSLSDSESAANAFYFGSGGFSQPFKSTRHFGAPVRPVSD